MSKKLIGVVIRLKTPGTAVVKIQMNRQHPLYKKLIKRSKKINVHYEKEELALGDIIEAQEVKPISKSKNWRLINILKK